MNCKDYEVSVNKIYSKNGNTIIELYCNNCFMYHSVVYKFEHYKKNICNYCDNDEPETYYNIDKKTLFNHAHTCPKRHEEEFVE